MKNKSIQYITPPHKIKEKARVDERLDLAEMLHTAEEVVRESVAQEYRPLITAEIEKLEAAVEKIKIGEENPDLILVIYNVANDIAHNSATLNKKIFSSLLATLCQFLKGRKIIQNQREYDILRVNCDSLRILLKNPDLDVETPVALELTATMARAIEML